MQMALQEGYAVLLPNPRGSSGRGQEFARANLGDMGGGDFKDILAGIDALVADGIVGRRARRDHRRQLRRLHVVMGGHADRPIRGGDPVRGRHRLDELPLHDEHRPLRRALPAGRPDRPDGPYPKWSPVFHAHKCKTPTLILHGEDDLCTPLPQATEFYNALVEAGCEVELVVYPREGHGWTEREHQIDTWNRMHDWLETHVENRVSS